jgi:hypothetical protein
LYSTATGYCWLNGFKVSIVFIITITHQSGAATRGRVDTHDDDDDDRSTMTRRWTPMMTMRRRGGRSMTTRGVDTHDDDRWTMTRRVDTYDDNDNEARLLMRMTTRPDCQ